MNCKQFEHLIPEFLDRSMDIRTMEDFRIHMDGCASCKEELSIQFLVAEGLRHLEDDGAFDLQKELDRRLEENNRKLFHHAVLIEARRYVMTVAVILLGIFLIYTIG